MEVVVVVVVGFIGGKRTLCLHHMKWKHCSVDLFCVYTSGVAFL